MFKSKVANLITKIAFNVLVIVFGLAIVLCSLAKGETIENVLSDHVLGGGTTETITSGKEPIRYKTWYSSVSDILDGNGAVAAAAQAEGTVLLKNEGGALPLKSGEKVSLYGVTAYDPMYSLDGAGEVKINRERQQFFYDEFKAAGLNMNESLANWYKGDGKSYYRKDFINIYDNTSNANGLNATLNGASWSEIPASAKNSSAYGADTTAIFIVGRMTNEGVDLPPYTPNGNAGLTDNDYLKFTAKELSILDNLHKNYAKVIVMFNQANPMQENLNHIFTTYKVNAAMWIGFPGSDGIRAVAKLLTNESTPSGGLSTAWYAGYQFNPSMQNYSRGNNVVKQEDIYVGYKYAETRYEDYVLGRENAGTYNYAESVSYPFGYGLSYADFSYEIVGAEADGNPAKNYYTTGSHKGKKKPEKELRKTGSKLGDNDDIVVKVKVTNTSAKYSGKQIVQVYLQKPYTQTDIDHKVEKPAVELVGFAKTKKLAPGESETVEVKIDANKYFASYDRLANGGKGGYVLSAGKYYLSVARNSHEAVNNILLKKGATAAQRARMDSTFGAGNDALSYEVEVDAKRASTYVYWTQGELTPTNLFDVSDPNVASGNANLVDFFTRSNWAGFENSDGTVGKNYSGLSHSGSMSTGANFNGGNGFNNIENIKSYFEYYGIKDFDFNANYPTFGKQNADGTVTKLYEMIGVEYETSRGASEEDKKKWNDFMDQLTWEEIATVLGSGLRRTVALDRIGKPYTNDVNASNAISWMFDMKLKGGDGRNTMGYAYKFDSTNREHNPTGYPCEGIIAATFNTELSYAVGQAIGEDGLWTGASGLYGFGLGLHRNPYHGRVGEYYSDDPFLTGVIGGYESAGAQSKGLYVYNKHFVLNDQEASRTTYKAWLTEQTFRETYLRPFEIAIEIGDAMNVMISFNNIGSGWSGNYYTLMNNWLRGEAAMAGFAVTDWYSWHNMNLKYGILAGSDLPDGNGREGEIRPYGPDNGTYDYGFYGVAARKSAQRILYTVANSNAMNFIGDSTIIITHDPEWFAVRDALFVTAIVVESVLVAVYVGCTAYLAFKKIKAK